MKEAPVKKFFSTIKANSYIYIINI